MFWWPIFTYDWSSNKNLVQRQQLVTTQTETERVKVCVQIRPTFKIIIDFGFFYFSRICFFFLFPGLSVMLFLFLDVSNSARPLHCSLIVANDNREVSIDQRGVFIITKWFQYLLYYNCPLPPGPPHTGTLYYNDTSIKQSRYGLL
jgi:hypothetical protein